jgi:hypothetical protein
LILGISVGCHEGDDSSCGLLNKKALCKGGDVLWGQIIFNVFDHLVDKFCPKLHPSFDKLGFEGRIANLDFVCVEGVLKEVGKMLEKLVDFTHEFHGQMHD